MWEGRREGGRERGREGGKKKGKAERCDTFIIACLANTNLESEVTILTIVRYTVYLPYIAHRHHDTELTQQKSYKPSLSPDKPAM